MRRIQTVNPTLKPPISGRDETKGHTAAQFAQCGGMSGARHESLDYSQMCHG